ncbi:hypothetical protein J6590_105164 [Homalodisca vitripennis]|nr:hypothetical protein J6590_105164 [Homalodisca vitripennis]
MKRFHEIQVFFPTRGHSFLPCDRDFGVIKRVIRRHDRVYSPEQYNKMIQSAKKLEPKFIVKSVKNHDILDFNQWWPEYFKKTCQSVRTKEPFKVSTYSHLTFSAVKRGYVTARRFIDGLNSDSIFKLYKGGEVILPSERAYNGKVPIKGAALGGDPHLRETQKACGQDLMGGGVVTGRGGSGVVPGSRWLVCG